MGVYHIYIPASVHVFDVGLNRILFSIIYSTKIMVMLDSHVTSLIGIIVGVKFW